MYDKIFAHYQKCLCLMLWILGLVLICLIKIKNIIISSFSVYENSITFGVQK